jgi:NADPH:quinone reductase-like Zn-dependent oxidoreductase
VRSLGADEVIDYTRQDFVESGRTYDVIIDILGKSSFERVRRVLAPRGRLVYVSFKEKQILQMLATALGGGPKVVCAVLQERRENLALARELIEAGQIRASIDRVFPLAQAAEAHRYAQSGARKGTVVLGIAASASATSSGGVESRRGSVSDAKRVGNASHLTETSYEAV